MKKSTTIILLLVAGAAGIIAYRSTTSFLMNSYFTVENYQIYDVHHVGSWEGFAGKTVGTWINLKADVITPKPLLVEKKCPGGVPYYSMFYKPIAAHDFTAEKASGHLGDAIFKLEQQVLSHLKVTCYEIREEAARGVDWIPVVVLQDKNSHDATIAFNFP